MPTPRDLGDRFSALADRPNPALPELKGCGARHEDSLPGDQGSSQVGVRGEAGSSVSVQAMLAEHSLRFHQPSTSSMLVVLPLPETPTCQAEIKSCTAVQPTNADACRPPRSARRS